jgi:hypothetical protein
MTFRLLTRAALLAIAAVLALASPALAKHGGRDGGGGGGVDTSPCATIPSWVPSLQTVNGQDMVVLDVGVYNGCVDEGAGERKMAAVSLVTTDTATGAWVVGSTIMASYGQWSYRFYIGAPTATPPARTLTFTVTKPNGDVQARRTTTLAEMLAPFAPAAA